MKKVMHIARPMEFKLNREDEEVALSELEYVTVEMYCDEYGW